MKTTARRFTKHYSVAEARALLPQVRGWLVELRQLGPALERADERNAALFAEGRDLGGGRINDLLRSQARLIEVQGEIAAREIQIEDLGRGRVGFPSLRGDREVLLSWQEGDEGIGYWHEPDGGREGREQL